MFARGSALGDKNEPWNVVAFVVVLLLFQGENEPSAPSGSDLPPDTVQKMATVGRWIFSSSLCDRCGGV